MRYTAQSTKYVFKNFIYLFPFAILPAVFLAVSTDRQAIFAVIDALLKGDVQAWTFTQLFRAISVLNFASWQSIVFGIVGVLLIIPCVALLMALLEKHMRIGKRTFNGLLGKLNDNFLSTAGIVVLILAIYELWVLITAAVLFLVSRIAITAVAHALVLAALVLLHILLMVSIGAIYLWLPCMQITGFRAFEALLYSYQLLTPIRWRITFSQILVLFTAEALVCVCSIVVPVDVFRLVAAALYAGILMIYCVRMQIAYFDRDHIDRADTAKYYLR